LTLKRVRIESWHMLRLGLIASAARGLAPKWATISNDGCAFRGLFLIFEKVILKHLILVGFSVNHEVHAYCTDFLRT